MNDEQTLEDELLKHDQPVPETIIDTPIQGDQFGEEVRKMLRYNRAIRRGYLDGGPYKHEYFG